MIPLCMHRGGIIFCCFCVCPYCTSVGILVQAGLSASRYGVGFVAVKDFWKKDGAAYSDIIY